MNLQKPAVLQACLDLIAEKSTELRASIRDAQEAANEDTKSSAGDKFETTREMMTQEIDKANGQLSVLAEMKVLLDKVKPDGRMDKVGFGSLVTTNEGLYFFSVSLGKVPVDGETVYALSMASPMGQAMAGATTGQKVSFRGRDILVKSIL